MTETERKLGLGRIMIVAWILATLMLGIWVPLALIVLPVVLLAGAIVWSNPMERGDW